MFFHSIDFVLKNEGPRKCYKYSCYTPKVVFLKGKKGRSKTRKCTYFGLFQRMLVVKDIVYNNHRKMLDLYEKACDEMNEETYWGADDDDDGTVVDVADDTNEVVRDDGF